MASVLTAAALVMGDVFSFTDIGGVMILHDTPTAGGCGNASVLVPCHTPTAAKEWELIPILDSWEVVLLHRPR